MRRKTFGFGVGTGVATRASDTRDEMGVTTGDASNPGAGDLSKPSELMMTPFDALTVRVPI